ncbi:hypothetical protein [Kineosporia mesophila]|nr:hypothetical protein [Kineosporia mesophila]
MVEGDGERRVDVGHERDRIVHSLEESAGVRPGFTNGVAML